MSQQHKALVLKNYMVSTLIDLLGTPLPGPVARARNRFILLFNDTAKKLEADRQAILKKYAELDEEGNLKIGTDGHYLMRDEEAFTKEFEEITTRTIAVPCVGEQFADFLRIKGVLENIETRLTVAETTVYDEIMQCFEDWYGGE